MLAGARPSIALASAPTATTEWSLVLRATIDGSSTTMPRPAAYTRTFAVPRSTARPLGNIRASERKRIGLRTPLDGKQRMCHRAQSARILRPSRGPRCGALVEQRDRPHRRAVGALDGQRQRDESAARDADAIEVGQVLDHGDPSVEEHVVRRALRARTWDLGREDRRPDAVIRRIVVAHRPGAARDEP